MERSEIVFSFNCEIAATIPRLTEPGMVMGTVGYAAPEQMRGAAADARTDIFSLGAILYEMLAGRRAFRGTSPFDVIAAILDKDVPPLALSAPNAAAIETVVRRCLEKRPDQRFQSARDLEFALDAAATPSQTARDGSGGARCHHALHHSRH